MSKLILEKLGAFLGSRDLFYLISLLCMVFIATHSTPRSTDALIKVDEPSFFRCVDTGCWYVARREIGWKEVAEYVGADVSKLRDDNPQVTGDRLKTGQMIRVR